MTTDRSRSKKRRSDQKRASKTPRRRGPLGHPEVQLATARDEPRTVLTVLARAPNRAATHPVGRFVGSSSVPLLPLVKPQVMRWRDPRVVVHLS